MTVPGEARAKILERIRAALGAERLDRARRSAVSRRLERHPHGTVPSRAKCMGEERVALFTDMLAKQGADVRRVATPKEAVGAIASLCENRAAMPRSSASGQGPRSLASRTERYRHRAGSCGRS